MKKIALILLIVLLYSSNATAQQRIDSYKELWKQVEQFESDKLPIPNSSKQWVR